MRLVLVEDRRDPPGRHRIRIGEGSREGRPGKERGVGAAVVIVQRHHEEVLELIERSRRRAVVEDGEDTVVVRRRQSHVTATTHVYHLAGTMIQITRRTA